MTREKKALWEGVYHRNAMLHIIIVHDMIRLQDFQRCTHTKHISLKQYNQIIAITLLPKYNAKIAILQKCANVGGWRVED